MAEYIERETLLKRLCDMCENEYCKAQKAKLSDEYSECLEFDLIVSEPPVDVAPVRHGRWDENGRCTMCGGHAPFWCMAPIYYKSPYCFECGAMMDLEGSDGK